MTLEFLFLVEPKLCLLNCNKTEEMPPRNPDIDPVALVNGEDGFPSVEPVVTPESLDTKRPPMRIVWRNVILMAYLHILALYGVYCMFYCKAATLLWSKYVIYMSCTLDCVCVVN